MNPVLYDGEATLLPPSHRRRLKLKSFQYLLLNEKEEKKTVKRNKKVSSVKLERFKVAPYMEGKKAPRHSA
jgi:hypothetical protein